MVSSQKMSLLLCMVSLCSMMEGAEQYLKKIAASKTRSIKLVNSFGKNLCVRISLKSGNVIPEEAQKSDTEKGLFILEKSQSVYIPVHSDDLINNQDKLTIMLADESLIDQDWATHFTILCQDAFSQQDMKDKNTIELMRNEKNEIAYWLRNKKE